jgi:hypothetical protein
MLNVRVARRRRAIATLWAQNDLLFVARAVGMERSVELSSTAVDIFNVEEDVAGRKRVACR